MPGSITHHLLAAQVGIALRKQNINFSSRALNWGAQGPDFLFFHRILSVHPIKNYRAFGSFMHDIDPDRTFTAMRDYLVTHEKDDIARSYTWGFLCHYALDRLAHPYINHAQKQYIMHYDGRFTKSIAHNQIEFQLDGIMLKHILHMHQSEYKVQNFLSSDSKIIEPISDEMEYVLQSILPDANISKHFIVNSYKDMRKIVGFLYDKYGVIRLILTSCENLLHIPPAFSTIFRTNKPVGNFDYANVAHAPWHFIQDESLIQNDSFFDIFNQAIEQAIELIQCFELICHSGDPLESITGKIGFNTGLPCLL